MELTQIRAERQDNYNAWDSQTFKRLFNAAHTIPPIEKITDYIEGERILPPGGPRPGPYSFAVNPYMIEPQNNMSLSSPVVRQYFLKGVQITCTTTLVENTVAYYIGADPKEQLLVSGTNELLAEWVELRLEALIDTMKLRSRLSTQFGNRNNRKSGDTQDAKFYAGGSLHLGSARSAPKMRMKSKQIIMVDECDSAKRELSTGEGSFIRVLEGRQTTYGDKRKFVVLSTPTTFEASVIWPLYCTGDQRHFYWPCPHCGCYFTPSTVDVENESVEWLDKFRADINSKGHVKNVWIECPHCGDKIYNHHKSFMLPNGEWRAHSIGSDDFTRSYYIPAFLSPIGMLTWAEIYKKYLEALEEPIDMPVFQNLYLGFPYKETGARPDIRTMRELRSGYDAGTIPKGILFLTLAVDVQQGSNKKNQDGSLKNPPRLELAIYGHGMGVRRWLVRHVVIPGDISDPEAGAWDDLYNMIVNGEFIFTRSDGFVFEPRVNVIDSGDGKGINIVYQFCDRLSNTYPLKGIGEGGVKKRKGEKVSNDTITRHNWMRYAVRKVKGTNSLLQISTNYYKQQLYRSLKQHKKLDGTTPTGYFSFPRDTPDEYFKQLTAEEMLKDGTFKPSTRSNEALDLAVYSMCAADLLLDTLVEETQKSYRQQGQDESQVNKLMVLKYLEQQTEWQL